LIAFFEAVLAEWNRPSRSRLKAERSTPHHEAIRG